METFSSLHLENAEAQPVRARAASPGETQSVRVSGARGGPRVRSPVGTVIDTGDGAPRPGTGDGSLSVHRSDC